MRRKIIPYNPWLKAIARKLRENMTFAQEDKNGVLENVLKKRNKKYTDFRKR